MGNVRDDGGVPLGMTVGNVRDDGGVPFRDDGGVPLGMTVAKIVFISLPFIPS